MRKIQVTLHKDGTQEIEVLGTTGGSCVDLTRALERRLGTVDGERVHKLEYHAVESEVERIKEPGQ